MDEYTRNNQRQVLLKNVEVDGQQTDVLFDDTITDIGSIPAQSEYEVIEGSGCALLPGLTDHHIHLRGCGAMARSLDVGPSFVGGRDELIAYLNGQPGHDWLRCVGYHESTLGELNRDSLRDVVRPVRIQHRSGKLWVLNDIALEQLGVHDSQHNGVERDSQGRATGRLFRMDDWLAERLNSKGASDLGSVRASLLEFGITHVTDASHTNREQDQRALQLAMSPVAVNCMGVDVRGNLKVMLDEDALPDLDSLIADIERAHSSGRGVAFHCVSRTELVVALSALRSAGVHPDDRIEHGGIVPLEMFDDLNELALPVITQPGFVFARGDQYLEQIEPVEIDNLYRYQTLLSAGVRVLASSDAPYGPLSPWQVMATAVDRKTQAGVVIGEAERVSPEEALSGYLRPTPLSEVTKLVVGQRADLCLLNASWGAARENLAGVLVRQTFVGGLSEASPTEDRA